MIYTDVLHHYESLLAEGNDPVLDPPELQAYMDQWDGETFLNTLALTGEESVLEIGVGTGRLAMRIAPSCRRFTGMDLSPRTIERAQEHLEAQGNVTLLCGDFLAEDFTEKYDVICSSLTFMHLEDKAGTAKKISSLLYGGGRAVISIDKDQSGVIDYGTRRVQVYPDTPEGLEDELRKAGLTIGERIEMPFAWIITARLQS